MTRIRMLARGAVTLMLAMAVGAGLATVAAPAHATVVAVCVTDLKQATFTHCSPSRGWLPGRGHARRRGSSARPEPSQTIMLVSYYTPSGTSTCRSTCSSRMKAPSTARTTASWSSRSRCRTAGPRSTWSSKIAGDPISPLVAGGTTLRRPEAGQPGRPQPARFQGRAHGPQRVVQRPGHQRPDLHPAAADAVPICDGSVTLKLTNASVPSRRATTSPRPRGFTTGQHRDRPGGTWSPSRPARARSP